MGQSTKFGVVSVFGIDIESVPEAVITRDKRKKLYDRWVNPKYPRSQKDERAAIARYWGGWEEGSGLVFDSDVWQRSIHVINPLWEDDKIPKDYTKWRVIDYGAANGINVCGWFAVSPKFIFVYRLLYERGLEIADLCREVIKRSHNKQVLDDERRNEVTGSINQYFHEEQEAETFWGGTILDSRSCSQSQQGETLEQIFSRYGLKDVRGSCGQRDEIQIPRLKDLMRIDYAKPHPFRKNENGEPFMGCPQLFVFDGRCGDLVSEIEGLGNAPPGAAGIINKKDPSHAIDVCKYMASDNPRYMGDNPYYDDGDEVEQAGTPYTGY